MEGIAIVSKMIPGAKEPILFILPEVPGFGDEQRRVADALRTIEAVEERPMSTIVDEVRKLAARVAKKSRGKSQPPARTKRSPPKSKRAS